MAGKYHMPLSYCGIFILFITVFIFSAPEAMAFKRQIDISLSGEGGEKTVPGEILDASHGGFGLSYTRYFSEIENGDYPYALREFLQHPSRLMVGLRSEGLKAEGLTRLYSEEERMGSFIFGGMYYTDQEDATGFGIVFGSRGGEREEWDGTTLLARDDMEGGEIGLQIFHYLGGRTRLELALISGSTREKDMAGFVTDDYDDGAISIGASAVIDNIYISGHLEGGNREWNNSLRKQDTGHLDLTFAYYFTRQWGLVVALTGDSVEEGDMKESTGTFSLGGEYYVRDYLSLNAALTSRTIEDSRPGWREEAKVSGIRLGLGVLF